MSRERTSTIEGFVTLLVRKRFPEARWIDLGGDSENNSEGLGGGFGIDVKCGLPAIRSALDLLSEDGRDLDQQLGGVVGILTRAAALNEQLRSIEQAHGEAARADARFIEVQSGIPPLEAEMTEHLVALRRAVETFGTLAASVGEMGSE